MEKKLEIKSNTIMQENVHALNSGSILFIDLSRTRFTRHALDAQFISVFQLFHFVYVSAEPFMNNVYMVMMCMSLSYLDQINLYFSDASFYLCGYWWSWFSLVRLVRRHRAHHQASCASRR